MKMTRHRSKFGQLVNWSLILLTAMIDSSKAQDSLSTPCRTASETCSQCLQRDSQCAWCTDPAFVGDFRCDVGHSHEKCPPQYLYQDLSHVQVTENVTAGTYEPQYGKIRQIEPQQVHVHVRLGETVTFSLKYYHTEMEEKDIYILNSDTEPYGVSLSYTMECKGVQERGQLCSRVRNAETVLYTVGVSIRDCTANAVVSVGIAGVREVVALYIKPQCGCDCERSDRQERRSAHCAGQGTLSCGACICDDPGRGGRRCECDLAPGATTQDLDNQCRESQDQKLCSGRGYCACGTCVCYPHHLYSGKYCECGNVECPSANGAPCNGRGRCSCGKCECDSGWSGSACDCTAEKHECYAHEGGLCSDRGTCVCNKCKCDDGYEGDHCERSVASPVTDSRKESTDGLESGEPSPTDGEEMRGPDPDADQYSNPDQPIDDVKSTSWIVQQRPILVFMIAVAILIKR